MVTLNIGTVEIFPIELFDRLGTITTLDGIDVDYKVILESEEGSPIVDWVLVESTTDMRADILLDTTGEEWIEGVYKLYLRINVSPEIPILGPFEFELS